VTAAAMSSSTVSSGVALLNADRQREVAFCERVERCSCEEQQRMYLDKLVTSIDLELQRHIAMVETKTVEARQGSFPTVAQAATFTLPVVLAPEANVTETTDEAKEFDASPSDSSATSAMVRNATAQFEGSQVGVCPDPDVALPSCLTSEANSPLKTEDATQNVAKQIVVNNEICDRAQDAAARLQVEVDEQRQREQMSFATFNSFQVEIDEVHHRVFVERWAARVLVAETLSVIVEMCNIACHRLYHEYSAAGEIAYTAEAYRAAMERHQTAQLLTMHRQRAADWMKVLIPKANQRQSVLKQQPLTSSSLTSDEHGFPDCDELEEVPQPAPPPVALSPRKPSVADRVARFDALRKAREVRHTIGMYSPKRPVQVMPLLEAL
jgi:hypothetical protein